MEQLGYDCNIQQEYDKITKKEEVTRVAQITINNKEVNKKLIGSSSK
jgi:hypothetical protein